MAPPLLFIAATLAALSSIGSAKDVDDRDGSPTVKIACGTVHGTTTSLPAATASINKFLGIPFAQSPPERFSPPKSPGKLGHINATAWSPACIQQFVYPLAVQQFTEAVFNNPPPKESEDCKSFRDASG